MKQELERMKKEKIRALQMEPMKPPKVFYIEPSMRAFRKAVDADNIKHGGVEAKKLERNIYAIFNKDRFLANLEPNRQIGDDIIAGNIYIIAINDNRFPISLTDEQVSKYALRFCNVETFDEMDVAEANLKTFFSKFLIDEEL